jgi:hypothetical protein
MSFMSKTPAAQLAREIKTALARPLGSTVDGKQPLYGHTAVATAYLVEDYPYGFTARTSIRYWLEHKPKKGWRFVSQTLIPKTERWNKPKASTYAVWGAVMYLDENGHVQWTGIHPYAGADATLAFVTTFPGADMSELRKVVPAKLRYLKGLLSGESYFTINGVRQPRSENDVERMQRELEVWKEIGEQLNR